MLEFGSYDFCSFQQYFYEGKPFTRGLCLKFILTNLFLLVLGGSRIKGIQNHFIWIESMVVQSLENLEILEKSGNKILVRENLENLEKSGNFTERAKNVIGNNAFSYWNQALR